MVKPKRSLSASKICHGNNYETENLANIQATTKDKSCSQQVLRNICENNEDISQEKISAQIAVQTKNCTSFIFICKANLKLLKRLKFENATKVITFKKDFIKFIKENHPQSVICRR